MRKLSLFLLLALVANASFAQIKHPKNKLEILAVCGKFMEAFKNGKFTDAYDSLKPYTVIEDYKIDTLVGKTKQQMIALSSSYGKAMSFERLHEKTVSNTLIQLNYLLKFEQSCLKFRFVLYNNGNGWTITNFKYNEEIDDLF
jgi:hypothetical protein